MSRFTVFLALLALLLSACNSQRGPKQVLVFKATPLAGNKSIELEEAKRVITGRLRTAELNCRFQVKEAGLSQLEVITFGADEADLERIKEYVTVNATLEFAPIAHSERDVELIEAAEHVVGEVQIDDVVRGAWLTAVKPDSDDWNYLTMDEAVFRERDVDGKPRREWLVAYEPEARVNGSHLRRAEAGVDHAGAPALHFEMRATEAWRMSMLTESLRPAGNKYRNLAIIYNGQIVSAPRVQSQINGQGMITGNFTRAEVEDMAILLGSGQLPCVLEFDTVIAEGK